jgi:hypothetical protein
MKLFSCTAWNHNAKEEFLRIVTRKPWKPECNNMALVPHGHWN